MFMKANQINEAQLGDLSDNRNDLAQMKLVGYISVSMTDARKSKQPPLSVR